MNNIEGHVCGVENSVVLHDLGVKNLSKFCWRWTRKDFVVEPYINDERSKTRAYLVFELIEMLPVNIGRHWMRIEPGFAGWNITYVDSELNDVLVSMNGVKPAHCLSDCLIWLIKNKHLRAGDLKL